MSSSQTSFLVRPPQSASGALTGVASDLLLSRGERARLERSYADTFDWRLHRAGWLLWAERRADRATLRLVGDSLDLAVRLAGDGVPGFARQLPPGRLQSAVAARADVRRLLTLATVEVESQSWRVLDERRKTVVRLNVERRKVAAPTPAGVEAMLPTAIRVLALKGYDREFEAVVTRLEDTKGLFRAVDSELQESLALLGRAAGDYSNKLRVDLEPTMPAARATAKVLRALMGTMIANEDGVRRSLDPEFLHDFRVSVRRTRTALGEMKGILPAEEVGRFRREFSWLGGRTGPTRDLDVLLSKMPEYRLQLPPGTGDDLTPLTELLTAKQRSAQQELARDLDSARFRELMTEWHAFLVRTEEGPQNGSETRRPIAAVAVKEVRRAWQRVLARGRKIDDDSPAEKLHRLRIQCKKLRYLLGFFRSLAPADDVAAALRILRRLQDNLGDFNDYGVQQRMLQTMAVELADGGTASPEVLLAVGRLIERLDWAERKERERFRRRFRKFESRRSRRTYGRLLASMESESEA